MTGVTPIAVLGYGCRFPGGAKNGPEFWELLRSGRDAVREVPPDRWSIEAFYSPNPGSLGRSISRWGGFLDGLDEFEAECFGMSPREAVYIDPQQRLLLETAWEALERAGIPTGRLAGSRTGVFIGISSTDYGRIQSLPTHQRGLTAFSATGSSMSIAANRLSYCLDLRGPSFSVDTACSSSLVALDRAVKSLANGETDLAFAGGVNAIITQEAFIVFSAASMLSPSGRCKAFDASADGFVRAEGAGVLVLKRLEEALRDGDPVEAVILTSGANQDGRTGGISLPNPDAQAALLEEVYAGAGIDPEHVSYVEAHGTGTPAGDPAEAEALGRVFGASRRNGEPLTIGSVKTNVGHLEPASGMAGVIKAILMLQHREIPPSLHFHTPNPAIDFEGLRLRVPTRLEPWPDDRPGLIGVNSFGFGGANAHVVLAEFRPESRPNGRRRPAPEATQAATAEVFPLVLSARSPEALGALAECWAGFLESEKARGTDLSDITHSAWARRTHYRHRLGFPASTFEEALEALRAFRDGESRTGLYAGAAASPAPDVGFVFCGQGAHWAGMGLELMRREPVFREAVERCEEAFRSLTGGSVVEELGRDEGHSRLEQTSVAQSTLFTIQIALTELWRAWGIRPAAIVGHSAGEIAASWAAGALSFEQAVHIVANRGICLQEHGLPGRMVAAALAEDEARELAAAAGGNACVAAVNSPQMVTLSGDAAAVERLEALLTERGVWWRPLAVRLGFHSSLVEPVREPFLEAIGATESVETEVPLISTVTARAVEPGGLTPDYWWDNIRRPVRFADAIEEMEGRGLSTFLEIGPHPVLSPSIRQCRTSTGAPTVFPSMRRGEDERRCLVASWAGMYAHGVEAVGTGPWPRPGRPVSLPPHPWTRTRYWNESSEIRNARLGVKHHPLLGQRLPTAEWAWESTLDLVNHAWLKDHCAGGQILFPAAGFVETAVAAARHVLDSETCTLDDLVIRRGIFLSGESPRVVQTASGPRLSSLVFSSRPSESEDGWIQHAEVSFRALSAGAAAEPLDPAAWKRNAGEWEPADGLYDRFRAAGLDYGPAFRGVVEIGRGTGCALGRIELPETVPDGAGWCIHPALLDACFHVLLETVPSEAANEGYVLLPERIDRIRFRKPAGRRVWSEARLREADPARMTGDIRVFDESGQPILEITGFRCAAVARPRRREALPIEKCIYSTRWLPRPLPQASAAADPLRCPDLEGIVRAAGETAARVWDDATAHDLEHMYSYSHRLTQAYIAEALRGLGFSLAPGERIDPDAPPASGKVLERFRRHFDRCVHLLGKTGDIVRSADGAWTVARPIPEVDLKALWREALATYPDWNRHYRLIEIAGARLKEAWSGAVDPLEILFNAEGTDVLEYTYQDWLPSRAANTFVQQIVAGAVAAQDRHRPLRVLEIGAGTGATTSYVLPVLPSDRCEYWFTDVSPYFLTRAEDKFRRHDGLVYRRLDVEEDFVEQGIPAGAFDMVIAALVLHATRDVSATLRRCREALVDGGLMIATEISEVMPATDFAFGLIEGWWNYVDDPARGGSLSLPRPGWVSLFQDQGFEETASGCDPMDRQAILAGRKPVGVESPATLTSLDAGTPPERGWLVFSDDGGVGRTLVERLRGQGAKCVEVHAATHGRSNGHDGLSTTPDNSALRRCLEEACRDLGEDYGILHLWALDAASGEDPTDADVDAAERRICHSALHMLQAAGAGESGPRRIVLATRGARVLDPTTGIASVVQAPLLGLARVAANEIAGLRLRMVDLDPASDDSSALWAELVADDDEEEVAWRGGRRLVPRMAPGLANGEGAGALDSEPAFRVAIQQLGNLDSLELREIEVPDPGPGEVQVEVRWVALNFRDVLRALGRYGAEIAEEVELGTESAGVVRSVGAGVTKCAPGDRVVFCQPGAFCSRMNVPEARLARIPDGLTMQAAVTMPVAFITADYALRKVGRLRAGERVLIHSAAGGVGLAAVQLARRAGARIYGTVGAPHKRDLLEKFELDRILNSRTLDFYDEILDDTDGCGVDVVLNSLAGPAMVRSLACLAPFGRFLELGKRDYLENTPIGLAPFQNNVSYHAIDAVPLLKDPEGSGVISLTQLMAHAERGELAPLPVQSYPVARVGEAFRTMTQGQHTGKLILDMAQPGRQVRLLPRRPAVRSDATYLITGAFGGVGRVVARWLVDNGAKHLALVSRSGPRTEEARRAVEDLRDAGIDVRILCGDVAEAGDLERIFGEVRRELPPLAGVFHLAMVLDDGALMNMDPERFHRAMRPKLRGACNLHRLTKDLPLDYFVLFSSVSGVFGSLGQANYAAANAGLDALAANRRAHGLPATAIAWGMIGNTGYVAEREELREYLLQFGLFEINESDLLKAMELCLGGGEPTPLVARTDWPRMLQRLGIRSARKLILSDLVDVQDIDAGSASGLARDVILAAPPGDRPARVMEFLKEVTGRVLGMAADRVDPARPLAELGLDSLMAIELAGQVESQLSVALPLRSLGGELTLARLSELLLSALADGSAAAGDGPSRAGGSAQPDDVLGACLVDLGGPADGPPLFCFHPIGGELWWYGDLARHLVRRYRVYGIRSRQAAGAPDEFESVDEMAEAYAQRVAQACPSGPIRLFGFSFGGLLALRVANLLERQGRTVSQVGVVEFEPQWSPRIGGRLPMVTGFVHEVINSVRRDYPMLREVPADVLSRKMVEGVASVMADGPRATASAIIQWLIDSGYVSRSGINDSVVAYFTRLATHICLVQGVSEIAPIRAPLFIWKTATGFVQGDTEWQSMTSGSVRVQELNGGHFEAVVGANAEIIGAQLLAAAEPAPV